MCTNGYVFPVAKMWPPPPRHCTHRIPIVYNTGNAQRSHTRNQTLCLARMRYECVLCRVYRTRMSIQPSTVSQFIPMQHKYSSSSLRVYYIMYMFRVSLPISGMMKSVGQIGFAIGSESMLPSSNPNPQHHVQTCERIIPTHMHYLGRQRYRDTGSR